MPISAARKARLALAAITVLWGSTFPLNKMILAHLPPFLYLTIRFSLAFILAALLFRREKHNWRLTLRLSLPIGLALGLANLVQTVGIDLTTANKAGFYTSLSVVLVPLLQAAWLKKRPSPRSSLSALLALVGLICFSQLWASTPDFNRGDALVVLCAFLYALHVLLLDNLASDAPRNSIVAQQFLIAALLNLPGSLTFEHWPVEAVPWQIWAILVFMVLGPTILAFSGLAWAQRHLSASNTALILILEPVCAACFSWLWLGETLSYVQLGGAAIIFLSLAVSSSDPAAIKG